MKTLNTLLVLTVSILSGCAGKPFKPDTASVPTQEGIPLVGTFKAQRHTFENGLKLVVVEDPSSPTFGYQTWFNVGSKDEVPGYTGLAHLFEHMMFKGTTAYPDGQYDRILEQAGVEGLNAFTNTDYTAYTQQLPTSALELVVKLESDRMVNLIVNEESFKTEREVVQNERRYRSENSPDGLMYQELFGLAFKVHPYKWPVIGYEKDLNRMTAKDAMEFYKTYYSPNHATIVVAGDVQFEAVRDLVAKYYGSFKPQTESKVPLAAEPEQRRQRRRTMRLNIQVEKLFMAYHSPRATHPDIPALEVLRSVLTSGKSGRLQRALVESGIAGGVAAWGLDDKDPGLLIFNVNLQKGKRAAHSEQVILRELRRLTREKVGSEELQRAKNQIKFAFYDGLGGNLEKCRFIGQSEIVMGGFENSLKQLEAVQQVTPEQIMEVARRYLPASKRNVIVGVPK